MYARVSMCDIIFFCLLWPGCWQDVFDLGWCDCLSLVWSTDMIYSYLTSSFLSCPPVPGVLQSLSWQDQRRSLKVHLRVCRVFVCLFLLPEWMKGEDFGTYFSTSVCLCVCLACLCWVPESPLWLCAVSSDLNNNEQGNAGGVLSPCLDHPKWIRFFRLMCYSRSRCVVACPEGLFVPSVIKTSLLWI